MSAALLAAKLALGPVLLPQARWLRRTALRLPEAAGAREGIVGEGEPGLRVLVVGDSSAAGVGVADQAQALALPLAHRLHEKLGVSIGWQLVARTGVNTAEARELVAESSLGAADVVVTVLGVNDVSSQTSSRDFTRQLSLLWSDLESRTGARWAVTCGLPPMGVFSAVPHPLRWYLGKYSDWLDGAAAEWAREQGFAFCGLRWTIDPALLAADGYHPGPAVYPDWADRLADLIVEGAAPVGLNLFDALTGHSGAQQRRAMAKAITLLESTRTDHRAQADELLTALLPHTGKSFRLGISGVPGVGKSTFIEALGLSLLEKGHRVAVLAVDPSSSLSGGSILGDKTRMEKLSVDDRAYIRPSPSSGTLGGVAEKTREAMLVCEAAGYDIVIVETVGVGQSETAVAGMTDMFVLMQLPNAGDDLQAIKKGVMELADLVVINKADIDPDAATRAQAQVTSALRILGQHGHPDHAHHDVQLWHPQVIQLSALKNQGIERFWDTVARFRELQAGNGRLQSRRQNQARSWMWERIDAGLKHAFRHDAAVKAMLPGITKEVEQGKLAASTAARQLLAAMDPGSSPG